MIDFGYPNWGPQRCLQLARTLFHINGNEDLNFVEYLRHELNRMDRQNRSERDLEVLRQRQGVCQYIENLLEMLEKSDEMCRVYDQSIRMKTPSPNAPNRWDHDPYKGWTNNP